MSVDLTEVQTNLIQSIAAKEGLQNPVISATKGTTKGDGYLGVIITVSIEDQKSGKCVNIVLKSAQKGEEFRKATPIRQAFLREIKYYNQIFPSLNEFGKSKGVPDVFTSYPRFFGSSSSETHECLALENLKHLDYKLWNRKIPMNTEHVELVFRQYGRFHGVSMAMKDQEPEEYRELSKDLWNIFSEQYDDDHLGHMVKMQFTKGLESVEKNQRASSGLKRYLDEDAFEYIVKCTKERDQYSIILHGDCWCNNMMFKYEDPKKPSTPTKMSFLDFQVGSVGAPVLDLAYFICVCCSKELLYNYKHFLKVYYDSLSETIRSLGSNPDEVFPYNVLEEMFRKHVRFGLHMSFMIIKIMLSEGEEIVDPELQADAGVDMLDAMNYDPINKSTYDQRIEDLVVFLLDNEFI